MQATIPDCSVFFKQYQHPIDDSPFPKMPKHLKPLLSQIADVINADYEFKRGPCNVNRMYVTAKPRINVLQLHLSDVRKTFYVLLDSDEWVLCDDEEFSDLYID